MIRQGGSLAQRILPDQKKRRLPEFDQWKFVVQYLRNGQSQLYTLGRLVKMDVTLFKRWCFSPIVSAQFQVRLFDRLRDEEHQSQVVDRNDHVKKNRPVGTAAVDLLVTPV